MTQKERIARWRLILGSESQNSFEQMGGVSLSEEQFLMDQALSAIYGGPGESFGGAGKGPSSPHIAKWLGDLRTLFDSEIVAVVQNDAIGRKGLKQLRIAETEKYAHVTFFFNGGRETPYEGEERILGASPKVATYDLKPEMSAYEVKDKLVAAIKEDKYDFIVVNFANGDMVGHTGIYEAIEKAVKAVDECVGEVVDAASATGYETILIADHGNADNAINADGSANTAHSLNPVPFIYVTENKAAAVENGVLADVAPSILHIMGLAQPEEMTGKNLIKD